MANGLHVYGCDVITCQAGLGCGSNTMCPDVPAFAHSEAAKGNEPVQVRCRVEQNGSPDALRLLYQEGKCET